MSAIKKDSLWIFKPHRTVLINNKTTKQHYLFFYYIYGLLYQLESDEELQDAHIARVCGQMNGQTAVAVQPIELDVEVVEDGLDDAEVAAIDRDLQNRLPVLAHPVEHQVEQVVGLGRFHLLQHLHHDVQLLLLAADGRVDRQVGAGFARELVEFEETLHVVAVYEERGDFVVAEFD